MLPLARALRLPRAPYVAIVGAGGKTSALFTLAREVAPCVVTTTTHVGDWQVDRADRVWSWPPRTGALPDRLPDGVTFVAGPLEDGRSNRYAAPPVAWLARLEMLASEQSVPLLVEADGARGHPLKAPAAHEPAIPSSASIAIVVAGMRGVGRRLNDQSVHRAERFARLSGLAVGTRVTPEAVVKVLCHEGGGRKGIPAGARRVVLLNQADTDESRSTARAMARALLPSFDSVVISSGSPGDAASEDGRGTTSTRHYGHDRRSPHVTSGARSAPRRLEAWEVRAPVAGIVLAAGGSSRLGKPKQLLDYRGKPFVRVVAETALAAGLSPVHVVVGAQAESVERALAGLNVGTIVNPAWEAGQATSVAAGVRAITAPTSAAVFLQADQPRIPVPLVAALVDRHAQGLFPIVAPVTGGHPVSPALFDCTTFPDLLTLIGDQGGRALRNTWGVEGVAWEDQRLLLDIDTLDDYRAMLRESESGR